MKTETQSKLYDTLQGIAVQCGVEVSLYPHQNEKIIVSMMSDLDTIPDAFDSECAARGIKVSYSHGPAVYSFTEETQAEPCEYCRDGVWVGYDHPECAKAMGL